MKKINLILLVFIVLFLVSCEKKEIKVGIMIYDESDTFMQEFKNAIIKNLSDYEYEVFYASNSQSIQNKQMVNLIDQNYDLLVINAVDRLAASSLAELANDKKIPIIFINREPLEEDIARYENIYYVGADADLLGIRQAEAADLVFKDPKNLNKIFDRNADNVIQTVILKGEQSHQDAEKRTRMSIEHLRALGYEVELLTTSVANWRRDLAYIQTKEIMEMFPEVELILSNNDDMALGAIDYLVETNRFEKGETYDQDILIIGVDATSVGKQAIKDGLLFASVLNDSSAQGHAVATLINYLMKHKPLDDLPFELVKERYVFVDGQVILKEHLE
ncbi:D-galactose substrate-binding protein, ABC transporter subunit [Paracholeplasma brassicae]|uniref:D-galactose/methyl-galactoside binding periplasmic protein MglB n=1 Tax=Acholeplasma brassicae TaxID=61635 RepID=U4KM72_9MOLU|nr:galactose ABC transporter substrate-binding protein [Paracholeplasma brassicae]CCV65197.1 D-galactose substrate-binding protein, ABC transporter subunit [Paracholeplasma brassicae]